MRRAILILLAVVTALMALVVTPAAAQTKSAQTDPPHASFVSSVDAANRDVSFYGRLTGATATAYRWDFGDGTAVGTDQNVEHTYPASPQTFQVVLTVTASDGAIYTATATVVPGNYRPHVTVTGPSDTHFRLGQVVQVSGTATDPEDGALQLNWTATLHHCSDTCHEHVIATGTGPQFSVPFTAPVPDIPPGPLSFWIGIRAEAADRWGVTDGWGYTAEAATHLLTVHSAVDGELRVNDAPVAPTTYLQAYPVVGSALTLTAPTTALAGQASFTRWNNGQTTPTIQLTMPDADLTLEPLYSTPISRRYDGDATLRSYIGAPTEPEVGWGETRYARYGNGALYWTPAGGVKEVHGGIYQRYVYVGDWWTAGVPLADEQRSADGVGRYNHFANGWSIYWSPSTGAWDVHGGIRAKWASTGWELGYVGYPTSSETGRGFDSPDRYTTFTKGTIYWTPSGGAHEVHGGIAMTWSSLRGLDGPLGYPTTDELGTSDGIGRYNRFSRGGGVYWTASTGAYAVYGGIGLRWDALGSERSYLGYPRSNEYDVAGGRRQDFQSGYITWNATTGQVVDRRY
jgi:PKD repeat protein